MKQKLIILMVVLAALMGIAGSAMAQGDGPGLGQGYGCGFVGAMPRLTAGQAAMVTPGLPNLLRSQPGTGWNSAVVGQIPGGATFMVLAGYGPQCANGMYWWLSSYNGITGWTPEGDAWGNAWTQPVTTACAAIAPRLTLFGQGRVTPGLPNVLRAQPMQGSGSPIVGQIPAGGVFTVHDGPRCSNGMNWWLVTYNNVNGWTSEGQNGVYWVEPYSAPPTCVPGLPTRLSAGWWGRVTPGLPNTLRADATLYSARIGQIPAGGSFYIIEGPRCANGMNWWRVNYNGVIGWTGEGQSWYWLERA